MGVKLSVCIGRWNLPNGWDETWPKHNRDKIYAVCPIEEDEGFISHGDCEECFAALKKKYGERFPSLLEAERRQRRKDGGLSP